MEDALSIDIFGKFDFPIPEFGIYDTGTPERIICGITKEYFLFVGMDIADMELVHIIFPFYWRMKEGSAVFFGRTRLSDWTLFEGEPTRFSHRPSLYLNYSMGERICQALFLFFYKKFL